jgi:glycosyl transferase family 2
MNHKILTAIPVLYNGDICYRCFHSVISESDILIIDNGSDPDVKDAIEKIQRISTITKIVIRNKENIYVNAAWNQALLFFLMSDYEQLIIMNSDLIMSPTWSHGLVDGVSCIPNDGAEFEDKEVFEGTPGIFIHLNKAMAKLVYPIPDEIKIWFGDLWVYTILRNNGYKTIVKAGIVAEHFHGGSQSVQKLKEFQDIIAKDKFEWVEIEKKLAKKVDSSPFAVAIPASQAPVQS